MKHNGSSASFRFAVVISNEMQKLYRNFTFLVLSDKSTCFLYFEMIISISDSSYIEIEFSMLTHISLSRLSSSDYNTQE